MGDAMKQGLRIGQEIELDLPIGAMRALVVHISQDMRPGQRYARLRLSNGDVAFLREPEWIGVRPWDGPPHFRRHQRHPSRDLSVGQLVKGPDPSAVWVVTHIWDRDYVVMEVGRIVGLELDPAADHVLVSAAGGVERVGMLTLLQGVAVMRTETDHADATECGVDSGS